MPTAMLTQRRLLALEWTMDMSGTDLSTGHVKWAEGDAGGGFIVIMVWPARSRQTMLVSAQSCRCP